MRPVHRIERVIDELREFWLNSPDLRLGQLLEIVLGRPIHWHTEDDRVLLGLATYKEYQAPLAEIEQKAYWPTADGKRLLVTELTDDHIRNIIKFTFQTNGLAPNVLLEAAGRSILSDIANEIKPGKGFKTREELQEELDKAWDVTLKDGLED